MKISKDDKIMFCMVGAMCFLLAIGMLLPHGNASVLEDMKSELKYDYMPLERESQFKMNEERFLNEDQSMVCKHLRHLGTSDSNEMVCVTVQDDLMEYEIFENLMIQNDVYPLE